MAAGGHDGRTMSDAHDKTHDTTHDTTHAAGEGHGSTPVHDAGHGDDAHGDDAHGAGHGDGHGHVSEPLGPIGWAMWGAGVLGVLVAAVMTAVFAVSTGFVLGG
jgi:hypothetical protein